MLRCSLDTRVLIGMIFTDLRHLCILLSKGRRTMITLGMDPHPGSHSAESYESIPLPARNKEKRSTGRRQCGSGFTGQSAASMLTVFR